MNNYVILKGKKDRLSIYLNDEVDFLTIRDSLVEKIIEARNFIGKGQIAIEFTNRKLSELEENVLIDLIKVNSDLNITYVFSESDGEVERIKFVKSVTEEGITKFHRGTLRSGIKLEYDGNIVVIGDVNPGALIRAKGNVIVLGFLNGTVYAGQDGDRDAFVGATHMNPVQLVIGHTVAQPMQNRILDTNKVDRKSGFKIAYLSGKEIRIEDFSTRLLND
ncbi:septum site-determining protein MinC [Fusobacterium sp.]|uniref:septum site-determining protein MinC n=1 Tax=Fusobacterium sp. TaxID=68766 RepID=UPI0025BD46C7|nr:septum site-determining protein MinC [Fusobacterium sp.]